MQEFRAAPGTLSRLSNLSVVCSSPRGTIRRSVRNSKFGDAVAGRRRSAGLAPPRAGFVADRGGFRRRGRPAAVFYRPASTEPSRLAKEAGGTSKFVDKETDRAAVIDLPIDPLERCDPSGPLPNESDGFGKRRSGVCVCVCLIIRVYVCPLCGAQGTSVFARSLCANGTLHRGIRGPFVFSGGGGGGGRGNKPRFDAYVHPCLA